ncbi:MAG: RNB domain-containing ribonuclease [Acidimicrobiales bacterium]
MKQLRVHAPTDFEAGFARIRAELHVPTTFPDDVLAAAEAATPPDVTRRDARDLPFIAIDPPGATDLDQALVIEETATGFRVHYAIADLGAFIEPGGPIDREARERGTTRYSPDLRTPLHPPMISEDRASLLPGVDRPALLWTIDLGAQGEIAGSHLERATVTVREAISYAEAQRRIDAGDPALRPLQVVGSLRLQREVDRGGVSLNLPSQEIERTPSGGYALAYDTSLPVEDWNAQISLLTGIVAGSKMVEHKIGILRTLPPTRRQDLRALRHQARALGIDWPTELDYPEFIRTVEPTNSLRAAFLLQAARSFRGAGYVAFDGVLPDEYEHGAIASVYAHVTAPLRRLVDRFGNEILLALYAGESPPQWAVDALDDLPTLMGRARSHESSLERAIIDYTEAILLGDQVGETFRAFVIDVDDRRDVAKIQLLDPAVVTTVSSDRLQLGTEILVQLDAVDTEARTVTFTPVGKERHD